MTIFLWIYKNNKMWKKALIYIIYYNIIVLLLRQIYGSQLPKHRLHYKVFINNNLYRKYLNAYFQNFIYLLFYFQFSQNTILLVRWKQNRKTLNARLVFQDNFCWTYFNSISSGKNEYTYIIYIYINNNLCVRKQ